MKIIVAVNAQDPTNPTRTGYCRLTLDREHAHQWSTRIRGRGEGLTAVAVATPKGFHEVLDQATIHHADTMTEEEIAGALTIGAAEHL